MQNVVCVGKTSGGTDLKCWRTCRNSRSSQTKALLWAHGSEDITCQMYSNPRISLLACYFPSTLAGFPLVTAILLLFDDCTAPHFPYQSYPCHFDKHCERDVPRKRLQKKKKGLHLDFIAAQFSLLVCGTDWMWRAGPANTESAWMSTVDRY